MKKQTVAFPVMPAVPWGTEERCMNLEAGFARQLLGLCGVLTLYRMWDGTDEEIAIVQAQVEKGIAALMGCGCGGGESATVKQDKSGYLVSVDAEGNITYISNQIDAATIEAMPPTQETDNTDDNVCAGVDFLVERVLADVLFSLDQAQLIVDQVKLVSEGLSAIMNTIPLFGATFGIAFDGWEEWTAQAASLTISTLKVAYSDPAVKLQMRENLYCNITAHINNIFFEEDYFSATENLPILESQSSLLADFMAGFNILPSGDIFDTVLKWYNTGALNESNTCAAEFTCDFDAGCSTYGIAHDNVTWTVVTGTPSGGEVCAVGTVLRLEAELDFPMSIVDFDFMIRKTGSASLSTLNAWLEWDGVMVRDLLTYSVNDAAYPWYQWPGLNPAGQIADKLVIEFSSLNTCIKDVRICFETA
jgi:hypothetical protein